MSAADPKPERILKTDLTDYAARVRTDGPYADNLDLDVLVVGAGFSGTFLLYEMRKAGYKTVLYDAGTGFGGTWRWNVYPGARVDSEVSIESGANLRIVNPRGVEDLDMSTNYPDWSELQAYFDHVDKTLNLSKDCAFQTVVVGAEFNEKEGRWTVKTADGRTAKTRYLIVAAGFAAKRYIPDFPSLNKFKGVIHHSSFWPASGEDVTGKRAAVIGTGASGVQITQEWGPIVKSMKVFQRTPNLAIPMGKKPLTKEEQDISKKWYPEIFAFRERCFAGFHYDFYERNVFEASPEEREAFWEHLWNEKQGFHFWLGNFKDYLFDPAANRAVYDFWAKKQRARLRDPKKKDICCPLEPPHPFGVKRPCLEQTYYEQLDRDNVEVVDISEKGGNGIAEFTETGIKMEDGTHHEVDVIALATGFDVVTGGMTNMGLKSIKGTYLQDEWKKAANTYLGTTIAGYPNMFHLYGPHGPTLLSNGPGSLEVQGRWIRDAIKIADRAGLKYIDPTDEASKKWKEHILELTAITLIPKAKSTYMGGSIPGKTFEPVCYAGGVGRYHDEIRAVLPSFEGFRTVPAGA